jgi:hypothetical protein
MRSLRIITITTSFITEEPSSTKRSRSPQTKMINKMMRKSRMKMILKKNKKILTSMAKKRLKVRKSP